MTRHWRLGLAGFGSVGQALAALLDERREELRLRHGLSVSIGLVATRRLGTWLARDGAPEGGGLDLSALVERVGTIGAWASDPSVARAADLPSALADAPVDVLAEMTPLDRVAGEPATSHVRAALAGGIHAITANKGPLALHGPELRREATAARLGLRFEATLMDCLPAQVLRETVVPVGEVESFAAIVNSTSNFVLDAMAAGRDATEAVAEAQRLGIAEADPSADLDGWDGAFKAAILAQVLLDRDVRAGEVERVGLSSLDPGEPALAAAAGERVRILARGSRAGGPVRVAPERLPAASLLGSTSGFSMALAIETSHAGRLEIALVEPHVRQTAYAILMDLLAIDRDVRAGALRPPRGWSA